MRIFQFIKWWWDSKDKNDQRFYLLLGWTVPFLCLGAVYNSTLFFYLAMVVPAGLVLKYLSKEIKKTWESFNDECPPEDELIIRKLKGIPTPSKERDDRHEYY